MKISLLTVFPKLYDQFLTTSLIARASQQSLVDIACYRFSDFCQPKERIDAPTSGPGSGMVIKPEVVERVLTHVEREKGKGLRIFFSPQGTKLTQRLASQLAERLLQSQSSPHLILVCPRYEGMDERVEQEYADEVISIGDYVLMGGDLPAQVFLEVLLRYVPGVVGSQESVTHDSFTGPFLDHPVYGPPATWHGQSVPEMVTGGNHAAIAAWRKKQAAQKTVLKRFDWFAAYAHKADDLAVARACIPPHYVVLMHDDVLLKGGAVGKTSIASLDIHDIARSCSTYGVKHYFIVSSLVDQQSILQEFLKFWGSEEGRLYNQSRYDAVNRIIAVRSFDEVISKIEELERCQPLLVATSAKCHEHQQMICYRDQGLVWQHQRPVLLIFGTGQGLAPSIVDRADFLLIPVGGMTTYNHLSVRSAAAIVLDRWLGLQPACAAP